MIKGTSPSPPISAPSPSKTFVDANSYEDTFDSVNSGFREMLCSRVKDLVMEEMRSFISLHAESNQQRPEFLLRNDTMIKSLESENSFLRNQVLSKSKTIDNLIEYITKQKTPVANNSKVSDAANSVVVNSDAVTSNVLVNEDNRNQAVTKDAWHLAASKSKSKQFRTHSRKTTVNSIVLSNRY